MQPLIEIIRSDPAREVKLGIDAILSSFDDEMQVFLPEVPDFAIVVRDAETNEINGGLYGCDDYGWAYIQMLALSRPYRGLGLGTRLMAEAETIARARGYVGAWLDTFDFQARPFYEKLGYKLFGELEGEGGAIARYFMKKRFP